VKGDAGAGNLITFAQFLFVALEGLIGSLERVDSAEQSNSTTTAKGKGKKSGDKVPTKQQAAPSFFPYKIKERKIPIVYYWIMVAIFFAVSVMNNKALAFHIALPFHMIFRSGSLIANVVMGSIVFRKRYTPKQLTAVIAVTVGVLISTFASVADFDKEVASETKAPKSEVELAEDFFWWIVGIALLTAALFLSSALGLFQEWLYDRYGKDNYKESMFYSHALAIPFFAFLWPDIDRHIHIYNESSLVSVPILGIAVPNLWLYLIVNVLTQYVCIRGVFTLTGMTGSSLTCTLVLSIRKFVSLIFSVLYFQNPFTFYHWIGTAFVFFGSTLYSWPSQKKEKEKTK